MGSNSFKTVASTLAEPLFTAALRWNQSATFTFGYIDKSFRTGPFTYTSVSPTLGFWQLNNVGYSVRNSSQPTAGTLTGQNIVDTGTTLLLVPNNAFGAYANQARGAADLSGWCDCGSALPDFNLQTNDTIFTIPGNYLCSPIIEQEGCVLLMASSDGVAFNILGMPFFTAVFAVFKPLAAGSLIYPTNPHLISITPRLHLPHSIPDTPFHHLSDVEEYSIIDMAIAAAPYAIRRRIAASTSPLELARGLHTSPHRRASVLFALSALSNSRETQHFNKITRLSRIEHSPPLKLIKTSEVDPFPCPVPSRAAPRSIPIPVARSRSAVRVWDKKALQVGRVILAEQARRTHRLFQALARAKRREAKQDLLSRREKGAWHQEREKMRKDMRIAGIWILLSIGTATALATWRFWPSTEVPRESGDLGRKIAARAAAAMPLPRAVPVEPNTTAPIAVPARNPSVPLLPPPPPASSSIPPSAKDKLPNFSPNSETSDQRWWKNLFWKQQ